MTDNLGVVVFGVERAIIGGDSMKCTGTIRTCTDSARTYGLKGVKANETVDVFMGSQKRRVHPGV